MLRLLITIYAIYLYNRLYPEKMSILNFILLCIFPAFFIAGTAAIDINYLNPWYDKPVRDYDYENFLTDLQNLKNIDSRFFFIFIPMYLSLTYILYHRSISVLLGGNVRKGMKLFFLEKKKEIMNNKAYYIIAAIITRYRFKFTKSTISKLVR
jgi:hypothetical protein